MDDKRKVPNKLFVMVVEVVIEVEAPDETIAQEMAHDFVNNDGYQVDSVFAKEVVEEATT